MSRQAKMIAAMGKAFSDSLAASLREGREDRPEYRTAQFGRLVVTSHPQPVPSRPKVTLRGRLFKWRIGALSWVLIELPRKVRSK